MTAPVALEARCAWIEHARKLLKRSLIRNVYNASSCKPYIIAVMVHIGHH
jgi:hypothetical protein